MARINIDNVNLEAVEVVSTMRGDFEFRAIGFTDADGAQVFLWTEGDLRVLMLRALQRLEAFYSDGPPGLPKRKKQGG